MPLQRRRVNFLTGTIQSLPTTTLTFSNATGLGNITITNGVDYLPLIINPAPYGSTVNSEIVWVTAYTANSNTAIVLRAQENTTNGGAWSANTVYAHGPTVQDYTSTNMIANVDFPTPTSDGNFLVSSGNTAFKWTTGISGNQVFGPLSASGITGALNQATISGNAIAGAISGSQILGTLNGGVVIPGSTISGAITNSNVTIPNTALTFTVNVQTTTPYTAVLSDSSAFVLMSGGAASLFFLPSGVFAISDQVTVMRMRTFGVTFSGGVNTTVYSTGATPAKPVLRAQYSTATAICLNTAPCQWIVTGDIA